ncbi:MAG: recombinase family protein [Firmicutes bacterium]|nr:recombinase family protein [Bacillota bacterium]
MRTVTRIERPEVESRKRVAAYCRVSTDHEAQMDSLENQMAAFNMRIAMHPGWELANLYVDEGLSGTSMRQRVQFRQMIEDCKAGLIDYIITKSVSRFARNTVDTLTTVRELKKYGVELYFEKEKIDTADSLSEMMLTIMASFAQEESRSISENVKWGIRKRFEAGEEVKVPLYGFYHTDDQLFLIQKDEAAVVREVFERFVHGEMPQSILNDMIARGVKPPAGNCWKRLQLDRMIKNEKYAGDVILQKTYVENHLTHRQIRNRDEKVTKYHVRDAHAAIVDRHMFDQAQKIMAMRNVAIGNSTYPYGDILHCPHCGKVLTHGSLNNFYYDGEKIQNGGWGCYGAEGCGSYLLIQNRLDEAVIAAFEEKYGERKERVDYYWLDDTVESIELDERTVTIRWKDGDASTVEMDFSEGRYTPSAYADFYNEFLDRIRSGEKKNKYKNLMGLNMED